MQALQEVARHIAHLQNEPENPKTQKLENN